MLHKISHRRHIDKTFRKHQEVQTEENCIFQRSDLQGQGSECRRVRRNEQLSKK